jgi:sugar phosphate permease
VSADLSREARLWRVRILVATWLSYAGFYFCRKNFAIVKSSVLERMELSTAALAHIFTAYLVAYMLGQFLTSFLGRRVPTRALLLAGMAVSLACNIAFGLCYLSGPAGYWPMLLFMVVNGFAQATGWPGNVGVLSSWLRRGERGRVMAIWATSYQLGSILAKVFAAFMLGVAGAVWSFWGAAAILAGVWLAFFVLERDHPGEVGLPPVVEGGGGDGETAARGGLFEGWDREVVQTILFMGSCYFVFKFLRYALDSWSPLAVEELFGVGKANAGYISTLFDWVGFLGVLFAGWVSDRLFNGRRYQTILLMTVGMLLAFGLLGFWGVRSIWPFAVGLSLCGFMLMGPDSLLAGVGAIDVGGRRGAVTAAGIINGLGSIGPIFQEEIIGRLLARHGQLLAFRLLIGVSVIGVLGAGYLALRSRRGQSSL